MPLYEFKCKKCGKVFEQLWAVGTEIVPCKDCGFDAHKIPSVTHFAMDGKMQTLGDNPANRKPPESSTPEGVQRAKEARQKHIAKGDVKEWASENKKRLKGGSDIDMN